MRISDWSSDVCSSDLRSQLAARARRQLQDGAASILRRFQTLQQPQSLKTTNQAGRAVRFENQTLGDQTHRRAIVAGGADDQQRLVLLRRHAVRSGLVFSECQKTADRMRSEEHTSELQSLMRISYAVFCLKKKQLSFPK